jgi:glycosyltransferase involved in cell wall biosynthesis
VKTILLSTYDISGGAARAAYRLHQGLQTIGVNSTMLVQHRSSDDRTVLGPRSKAEKTIAFLRPGLDSLPLALYRNRHQTRYSLNWLPDYRNNCIEQYKPDVVNLHWIGSGFSRLENLRKLHRPIVWTMHDMWGFTGGCHYTEGCDRYLQNCGKCPQLGSQKNGDLSRWNWNRKHEILQTLNLTIVTPSQWLANCSRSSSILGQVRTEVIPYGIDLDLYRPHDRILARKLLKLPTNKPLILFGASSAMNDPRKGIHLLERALQHLYHFEFSEQPEVLILGASHGKLNCPFPIHYLGVLQDDISLALAYSCASVFVAPSLEDNLPNTVIEAIACGVPCVAFRVGGMPDLIEHGYSGYLVNPFEVSELAQGLYWALTSEEPLGERSRQIAEERYALRRQAKAYRSLFESLILEKNQR